MVDTIVYYKCRICKEEYDTMEEAKRCEKRGVPKKEFIKGSRVKAVYNLPESSVGKDTGTVQESSITISPRGDKHIRIYVVKFDHDEWGVRSLGEKELIKRRK